ncbi:MAG: HU family DNA-binding protein [Alistipes sp.]|nr:HU family DNA-binding protein [Alistipes sp.]MBQ8778891.1 HU family DNA-binding protein [Alistipes sp.]MBR2169042.1 HU family DNA-binding protein [Alistipes sp.]MBR2332044.1 HU family DNA-binding protein [Alistipes sp.]MBR2399876.1 HU family DNA-binding protein [Alistipes sp.]
MNKSQLVNAIAETTTTSRSEVKKIVDTLFKIAEETLDKGEKVVISGFGVFSMAEVSERMGRNPRTGEKVKIAARRNVRFRSNMNIK